MNNTYVKLKINRFLAFLQEQAQAKGISIEDFCKPIGYTPRMIEALAEYSWLQPSDQTLAVLKLHRAGCQPRPGAEDELPTLHPFPHQGDGPQQGLA